MRNILTEQKPERTFPVLTEEEYQAAVQARIHQFDPCPSCEICGGVGYVSRGIDLPFGHPDYGKVEPCPNLLKRKVEKGQIDPRCGLTRDEISLMDWGMVQDINQGTKARDVTRAALERGEGMILLHGNFGQAKTLTMKIAVAVAIRAGKRAAYAKMTSVLDDIRKAYDAKEAKMTALLDRIAWWTDLDVLAIDEFDKSAETDWAQDRMFNLFDDRWVRAVRGESVTIAAANITSTAELPGYLKSRIEDNRFALNGYVVYLDGPDGRKVMPEGYRY